MDAGMTLTQGEYLEGGGAHCPACNGTELVGSDILSDDFGPYETVVCEDCGATWTDRYGIVEYVELDLHEDDRGTDRDRRVQRFLDNTHKKE
jgi:uncharacterized Zn finger protein